MSSWKGLEFLMINLHCQCDWFISSNIFVKFMQDEVWQDFFFLSLMKTNELVSNPTKTTVSLYYVPVDGLELLILLALPTKLRKDMRHHVQFMWCWGKAQLQCILGKHSTNSTTATVPGILFLKANCYLACICHIFFMSSFLYTMSTSWLLWEM